MSDYYRSGMSRWESAFAATCLVLGETTHTVETALGKPMPIAMPAATASKEARAAAVASALASVLRALQSMDRAPWRA